MNLKDGAKLNLNSLSYRVKEKIGKGGFGNVYMVQEEAPFMITSQMHVSMQDAQITCAKHAYA